MLTLVDKIAAPFLISEGKPQGDDCVRWFEGKGRNTANTAQFLPELTSANVSYQLVSLQNWASHGQRTSTHFQIVRGDARTATNQTSKRPAARNGVRHSGYVYARPFKNSCRAGVDD
jgi:hypothetical protein